MKLLITGGTGQVGFELQHSLQLHGQCLAPKRQTLDLSDSQAVDAYLIENRPDIIINAAAYTAVDLAENNQALAYRLNAELPQQLAEYSQQNQVPLIHYSSDYVYAGTGQTAWLENSPTAPQNLYGQSKLAGDQAIIASGCRALIFRTSWVYSARCHNFMKTLLRLAQEKETLSIVNDQIGAPTPARLIAQVTALAIRRKDTQANWLANPFNLADGVYHLAPRGETSWYQFAENIIEHARNADMALKTKQIKGIPTQQYPTPATRPLNSRMSLNKLESALAIQLPDWQSALKLTIREYLS